MSHFDYEVSKQIAAQDYPFYALIMAAMRQADTDNIERLKTVFPEAWEELRNRYWAPGGFLPGEPSREVYTNLVRDLRGTDTFTP